MMGAMKPWQVSGSAGRESMQLELAQGCMPPYRRVVMSPEGAESEEKIPISLSRDGASNSPSQLLLKGKFRGTISQ
jgi:hypothetical protein